MSDEMDNKMKKELWALMLATGQDYDYLAEHYREMVGEEPPTPEIAVFCPMCGEYVRAEMREKTPYPTFVGHCEECDKEVVVVDEYSSHEGTIHINLN